MDRKEITIRDIIREEALQKIFDRVFDERTILAIHSLATKGYFNNLEYIVSSGKEAVVCKAVDAANNPRAVKIYKIETSDFKNMLAYIEHDPRFTNIGREKHDIVYAWTRKEFRNLEELNNAGIRVPLPIAFRENVLVMEFIGQENAAPLLKYSPPKDILEFEEFVVRSLALMVKKAGLIHADLSEYNILNNNEEFVIIDCGQAVALEHPRAEEFFERDLRNMAKYLTKQGLKTDASKLREKVRKFEV
ncbi:MAG: serine protein kinase RIO [Candidatus Diapherotrites archaeon]|nr:serine protein kinase RIO [Candidatus Diapherotrites archaeon]